MDRTTINTKVPKEFAEAVAFFAEVDRTTVSSFTKAALMRTAAGMLKEKVAIMDQKRKQASLMRDALNSGTWQKFATAEDPLFPSTEDGWRDLIQESEAIAETVQGEISEMQKQLASMGVTLIG